MTIIAGSRELRLQLLRCFRLRTELHCKSEGVGCLRCRTLSCVSRASAGLPPDFHWAKNSEKPQDSEFSQQRLREFLTIECSRSVHSIVDLSLLSVAQRKIFRKPRPSLTFERLFTAAGCSQFLSIIVSYLSILFSSFDFVKHPFPATLKITAIWK